MGNAIRNGTLRHRFMNAAAALLGVPQRYEQLLEKEQIQVNEDRLNDPFTEGSSSNARTLSIGKLAKFLATNGVHPDEAEKWRPWATAYIEMELNRSTNSDHAPILIRARDMARKCIAENPAYVLRSVHADAPGNYNPALEQARKARRSEIEKNKDAIMTDTQQPPSCAAPPILTEDFAQTHILPMDEEGTVQISGWDDEDTRMGPG
jgi:hypothetical protein